MSPEDNSSEDSSQAVAKGPARPDEVYLATLHTHLETGFIIIIIIIIATIIIIITIIVVVIVIIIVVIDPV